MQHYYCNSYLGNIHTDRGRGMSPAAAMVRVSSWVTLSYVTADVALAGASSVNIVSLSLSFEKS